jgi:hypothetical protein
MKYSCDKQQWYLNSFLLGVKLCEELHEKSIFWMFSFVTLQVTSKGVEMTQGQNMYIYNPMEMWSNR